MLNGADSANAFAGEELICAIDLGEGMYGSHGLETGMNYELLQKFAKDNHCNIKVVATNRNYDFIDSLQMGKIDMVITSNKSSYEGKAHTIAQDINGCSEWVIAGENLNEARQLETWVGYLKASEDFKSIKDKYSGSFNPQKRAERGVRTRTVSPYDDLFREYAKQLGWDWRMLAAVVYQESKFSIGSRSHRGAQGLMQVMPQTGKAYGIDNLLDPEQNIIAGTKHLKRLQKMFSKHELEHEELIKFTLAAYNAGEGRVTDCRNLASAKGFDDTRWDEIIKVELHKIIHYL
jgi:membrane-bound lytic murein transglycosylase F